MPYRTAVADYVRRLERPFQIAYGREGLSSETRDTLLYSQLQEGLSYNLMKSPVLSGSDSYKQLCVSAKREEKWIVELSRRQQYLKDGTPRRNDDRFPTQQLPPRGTVPGANDSRLLTQQLPPRGIVPRGKSDRLRKCFNCGSTEHLARECKQPKKESPGYHRPPRRDWSTEAGAKTITSQENPLAFLYSDDDSDGVRVVRIHDRGSKPRRVAVDLQGVPATGVVDSGADITIVGAELLRWPQ